MTLWDFKKRVENKDEWACFPICFWKAYMPDKDSIAIPIDSVPMTREAALEKLEILYTEEFTTKEWEKCVCDDNTVVYFPQCGHNMTDWPGKEEFF